MKTLSSVLVGSAFLIIGVGEVVAGQITLQNATATYSQQVTAFVVDVKFAIDDPNTNPASGWAILRDGNRSDTSTVSETAVFETDPFDPDLPVAGPGTLLIFTLDFQYEDLGFGADSAKFNLGRFRLSVTTDDRSMFADGLHTNGDVTANWTVLDPSSFSSTDITTSFTKLLDNSLLANPDPPNVKQTYTVVAQTTLTGITGLRLEVLEDDSLVLKGPGRFPVDGNFVLTNFELDAEAIPEPSTLLLGALTSLGLLVWRKR